MCLLYVIAVLDTESSVLLSFYITHYKTTPLDSGFRRNDGHGIVAKDTLAHTLYFRDNDPKGKGLVGRVILIIITTPNPLFLEGGLGVFHYYI